MANTLRRRVPVRRLPPVGDLTQNVPRGASVPCDILLNLAGDRARVTLPVPFTARDVEKVMRFCRHVLLPMTALPTTDAADRGTDNG